MLQILRPYFSRRVLSMVFLGIPYGMMYFLAVPTLQVWLKDMGVQNKIIGIFAWASLPYVLKFMWAPLIDYWRIPWLTSRLGHRRSWLVVVHLCLIGLLISLGNTQGNLWHTAFLAFSILFFASIQDIVIDTYRIEILSQKELGPGVGMLSLGYRLGSVTATAGVLYLAEMHSWTYAYHVMASFVTIGIIATLMNPEPHIKHPSSFEDYMVGPLREIFNRPRWGIFLLFIVFFRVGDAMIHNMVNMFYIEVGFTKIDIANITKIFGMFPTIVGGLLGGLITVRFSLLQALFFSGILHAFSHIFLIIQAHLGYAMNWLYVVIFFEHITGGIVTTVFMVYLSRQCYPKYTITQYAFFTSLWSLATIIAGGSGWLVDVLNHDWPVFFCISFFISLPGIILIPFLQMKTDPRLIL